MSCIKFSALSATAIALFACDLPTTQEFSPELQRNLVPLYIAIDMEDSCSNVTWDENGYSQQESKVLSLAAQDGVTSEQVIKHMSSENWMTVEEAYFIGFLQGHDVQDLDDYDRRICQIAASEDKKNTEVGKLITVR